jgi:hypothetical protein
MLGVTVYEPFASPEKLYVPEALAVFVAVDVPVSTIVAPLPAVPTPPVMVQVAARRFNEKVFEAPAALAVRTAV